MSLIEGGTDAAHGTPIACVVPRSGALRPIYVSEPPGTQEVKVRLDETIQIEPTHLKDARDVVFIGGPAGSGKSTIASMFAARYRAIWGAKRPIVMISKLAEDTTLQTGKQSEVKIMRLDVRSLVESPLELDELGAFGGALLICDDLEGLDKVTAEAVHSLVEQVCALGRHANISLLYTSHLLTDYKRTRLLLGESMLYVIFPHGSSQMQVGYLLTRYAGCDRKQVAKLRKLPSRWVAVKRTYPPVVVSEHVAYMLHEAT